MGYIIHFSCVESRRVHELSLGHTYTRSRLLAMQITRARFDSAVMTVSHRNCPGSKCPGFSSITALVSKCLETGADCRSVPECLDAEVSTNQLQVQHSLCHALDHLHRCSPILQSVVKLYDRHCVYVSVSK